MLALISGAEILELLGPLVCAPGQSFSEVRFERDHPRELGHAALELDVREHHVHKGPREGSELRTVGLGENVIAGEFAKQLHVAATDDARSEARPHA